jgi:WD40 repeat protein/predicted Ser/Thr protein kinase
VNVSEKVNAMASTPMIDQILDGRYQITQVLAQGGFGQTYLAVDMRRPGQPICVVKQLRSVANPELLPTVQRLFKTEAAILEKLGQHDCIPRLLAYFEESQEFYLVQEFIPGHPLDQELLPKQPLPIAQVIGLLTDILEILVFVHAQGVIHRDIKPANIIRRQPDQKLVLIDFGTVKEIRTVTGFDAPKLTVAVGTPAYMPVEQFHGYPQLNSDIYALGVVGIQAMSGLSIDEIRTLITPNYPQTTLEHWSDSLPPIEVEVLATSPTTSDVNPEQRLQLAAVLDKMVQLDYRERYQSAASVLNELETIHSNPSVAISSPKIAPSYISPLSSELPSQLPNLLSTTSATPITRSKHRQLARRLLIGSGLAIALITGAYKLPSLISQSPLPTVQTAESAASPATRLTLARTLSGHTDRVWSVALSQDGQTLVSGSQDDTIKVWNPTTGELSRTINAQAGSVRAVSLSADGKTLAAGNGDNSIKVWDLPTGKLRYTLSGHTGSVWSVALSRDGKTLVSGSQDNSIKVWNVETGKLVRTLTGHTGIVYDAILSPYEKTIVSASADKTIKVWDLETGRLLRSLAGHGDVVRSLTISPDGQTLASASWDRTLKIWNLQSGELLKTLEGHQDRIVSVAFSAEGKTLASASLDKTIKIWNPQTGTTLQTLSAHTDWVLSVASESAQVLVSGSKDKTIKIWQQ